MSRQSATIASNEFQHLLPPSFRLKRREGTIHRRTTSASRADREFSVNSAGSRFGQRTVAGVPTLIVACSL